MSEKVQLKYRWRQTWDDVPDDYTGRDPDNLDQFGNPAKIGRFYLSHVPSGMGWRWFAQWETPGTEKLLTPSGVCDTAREAAKAIEDAYDAFRLSVGNSDG